MKDKHEQQYVRQNKNFLERPMFALDEVEANKEKHCWTPMEGFRLETDYKLPTRTDQILLYYLMLRAQELGWRTDLMFTKHELLKSCGVTANKKSYARLDESLERWFRIRVYYQDSFVCTEKGKTYKVKGAFHILDSYRQKEVKVAGRTKIYIQLSPSWIEVVRTHAFFEMLDFRVIKQISSPLGLRLYEILSKNFYKRTSWSIDSLKLAEMIPLQVKYASDCIKKIKPLIKKINEAYGAKVYSLTIKKPRRGVAIFTFKKDVKALPVPPDPPFPGRPAPVPGAVKQKSTSLPLFDSDELDNSGNNFNSEAYFEALNNEQKKKLLSEFEKSLKPFDLNRYRKKGLSVMKTTFHNFCRNYAEKNKN